MNNISCVEKPTRQAGLFLLVLLFLALFFARPANATVLSDLSSKTYVCAGASTYAINYPFLSKSHIVVTTWLTAAPESVTTLARGGATAPSNIVTMYGGGSSGLVTLTNGTGCATNNTLKITRVVPVTQTIAFRSQGIFSPASHEYMGDKLTMLLQQLRDGIEGSSETTDIINTHIASSDDHTLYFYLPGRTGGQIAYGGLSDGDSLTILSASTGGALTYGFINLTGGVATISLGNTNGGDPELNLDADLVVASGRFVETPEVQSDVYFGSGTVAIKGNHTGAAGVVAIGKTVEIYVDETNSFVGINEGTPLVDLDVDGTVRIQQGLHLVGNGETAYLDANEALVVDSGDVRVDEDITVSGQLYGGTSAESAKDFYVYSTRHATKGRLLFGGLTGLAVIETTGFVGIGNAAPTSTLTVQGTIAGRAEQGAITSYTLDDTSDCGVYLIDATNGGTLTLPDRDSGNDGCVVHFINSGAAGAVQINVDPTAGNSIWGNCDGVDFPGTPASVARNTLATQKRGDRIGLVATGSKAWWIIECEGVWAPVP